MYVLVLYSVLHNLAIIIFSDDQLSLFYEV